jgi:hypothetical protein
MNKNDNRKLPSISMSGQCGPDVFSFEKRPNMDVDGAASAFRPVQVRAVPTKLEFLIRNTQIC